MFDAGALPVVVVITDANIYVDVQQDFCGACTLVVVFSFSNYLFG